MKVNYDKLWNLLIDKKMTRTNLKESVGISSNVLARMGHKEPISMESVAKICMYLKCTVDDILEFQDLDSKL